MANPRTRLPNLAKPLRIEVSKSRRALLLASAVGGAGVLMGCRKDEAGPSSTSKVTPAEATSAAAEGEEPEVTAVEDLMREHGVIRRALVVYREASTRLRTAPASVPVDALRKAAKLLRTFGEDYHEKALEEGHIFPTLKGAKGPASRVVDVLAAQHQRGREITDYVVSVTGASITPARAEPIARTLEAFTRMYEEHAAVEDTVVFPAWKETMSPKQLDEMGDLFEEIEHKTFGKDGFEDALNQIEAIERAFGLELDQFTAHPPPKT